MVAIGLSIFLDIVVYTSNTSCIILHVIGINKYLLKFLQFRYLFISTLKEVDWFCF